MRQPSGSRQLSKNKKKTQNTAFSPFANHGTAVEPSKSQGEECWRVVLEVTRPQWREADTFPKAAGAAARCCPGTRRGAARQRVELNTSDEDMRGANARSRIWSRSASQLFKGEKKTDTMWGEPPFCRGESRTTRGGVWRRVGEVEQFESGLRLLPEHRLQTVQDQDDPAAKFCLAKLQNQLTVLITWLVFLLILFSRKTTGWKHNRAAHRCHRNNASYKTCVLCFFVLTTQTTAAAQLMLPQTVQICRWHPCIPH